jgi:hypothetical protein
MRFKVTGLEIMTLCTVDTVFDSAGGLSTGLEIMTLCTVDTFFDSTGGFSGELSGSGIDSSGVGLILTLSAFKHAILLLTVPKN